MALPKKVIEREMKAAEAAAKAHLEGAEVNDIVAKAFKKELEKFPEEKKVIIKGIG